MPCRDEGYEQQEREERAQKAAKMRGWLCEACGILEDNNLTDMMSVELLKWWRNHQAEDRARQAREAEQKRLQEIAATAINSLSTDQIEALRTLHGLNLKKR